jgi:hypothetical protein
MGAHTATPPPPPTAEDGTRAAAAAQAKDVANTARSSAAETMTEARGQATEVLQEAKTQAHTMVDDAKREVRAQADQQTGRAAQGLRGLAGQVHALAEGRPEQAGVAGDYARRIGERVSELAERMENGGLDGMLDDARRFARRRPGTFLLSAAALGFAAGRLLRAGAGNGNSDGNSDGNGSGSGVNGARAMAGSRGPSDWMDAGRGGTPSAVRPMTDPATMPPPTPPVGVAPVPPAGGATIPPAPPYAGNSTGGPR